MESAPGDRGAKGGRLSLGIRLAHTRAHRLLALNTRDATMNEDYGKISRDALVRANEISERAIFWGLVLTVVVVVVAMLKGIFAFG